MGIKYLSDLLYPNKLQLLRQELLRVYDEILMCDIMVEPEGLSRGDVELYFRGQNANYWAASLPKSNQYKKGAKDKRYRADKTLYYRRVERFRELLSEIGAETKKKQVRTLMDEMSKNLLADAQQKCVKMTSNLNDTNESRMCQNDQVETNDEMCQNDPLFYSVINTSFSNSSTRRCLVTGLDISMQKEDSKFLCTSGVNYYQEYQPETWEELKKRLSPKWKDAPTEKQIEEIHHSIRNEYHNKKNNTKRSIAKVTSHPSLFNQFNLISNEKLIAAGYTV
jgi:hypothetical protein